MKNKSDRTEPQFNNFFQRRVVQTRFRSSVSGLATNINSIYNSSNDLFTQALITETSHASDSGSRNLRVSLATCKYLEPFSIGKPGFEQVPIMAIHTILSHIVFTNYQLRNEFNLRIQDGTVLPNITVMAEINHRGTENNQTSITFAEENRIPFYNFKDTIFDSNFLLENNDAKDFVFSILIGLVYNNSYKRLIKFMPYKQHSYSTNMCTSAAIKFEQSNNGAQTMTYFPFHTLKTIDNLIDPTVIQASFALFSGLEILNSETGVPPETGTLSSFFDVYLTSANYFEYLFSIYICEITNMYCNPSVPYRKDNSSSQDEVSINAMTSEKQSSTIYEFALALKQVNQNWFAEFVRNNRQILGKLDTISS